MESQQSAYFHEFDIDISDIALPEQFTYPFYYQPHPIIKLAAQQVQNHLLSNTELNHNFGLSPDKKGLVIGKMFGVLLVRSPRGKIGFLTAFSGKLANSNHIPGFVPSIFDMLNEDGFYKKEESNISQLTLEIEALESDPIYQQNYLASKALEKEKAIAISKVKDTFKKSRTKRRLERNEMKAKLSESEFDALHQRHKTESLEQQHRIKFETHIWTEKVKASQALIQDMQLKIKQIKVERKQRSNALQQKLFDQYNFLNKLGVEKNVMDVFAERFINQPPSGSGECAAPKLLNYAFQNQFEPLALGEFWWGESPKSEIRKHGYFYPSCKSKCEPILSHMLIGLDVEANPLAYNHSAEKAIEIIFEDDDLLVINKPHDLLSVPGKDITDSVQTRMEAKFPKAKGHLIVHRLDMSTSGIMIIAKNKESHQHLQASFINRKIKKRYTAILNGKLGQTEGEIRLPLRVDLEDRPRQLVCFEHGKPARTIWKSIREIGETTLVHFYPVTGRTHQLRMHAAHASGLDTPIVGDDLYGKSKDRLYLHASFIQFEHPRTNKSMTFTNEAPFGQ